MSADAVRAVEALLEDAQLSRGQAQRLHGAIAAAEARRSARDLLNEHLDALRGAMGAQWLHDVRRLVREALAAQAQEAIDAAEAAYAEGIGTGEHIVLAVRQALTTD